MVLHTAMRTQTQIIMCHEEIITHQQQKDILINRFQRQMKKSKTTQMKKLDKTVNRKKSSKGETNL